MIDLVQRLGFDAVRCEAQFSKGVAGNIEEAAVEIKRLRDQLTHSGLEREAFTLEIEHLRKGYEDIKAAAVAGRICDDVAWFDTITTLYDFCDLRLNDGKLSDQQTRSDSK